MKKSMKYGWILFLATVLFSGCQNADEWSEDSNNKRLLEFVAEIENAEVVHSRANGNDDFDSKKSFEAGDAIGFYSIRDEKGNPENGYSNFELVYNTTGNCFTSDKLSGNYANNFGNIFSYYPYEASNNDDINIYSNDNEIEDLLIANGATISNGRIYLTFRHALSMLIIIPGTGFEEAAANETNEVAIVLKSGYKASVKKNNDSFSFSLLKDNSKSKKIIAKRRENVSFTEGEDAQIIPVCYSAILPYGDIIDYIEMNDNYGKVQKILPDNIKTMSAGKRYPINIYMEGTTPTIWPYEIQDWGDGGDISLGGEYGIDTPQEFEEWITAYNSYTAEEVTEEAKKQLIEILKDFGEMKEGKWKFQLNADIDCSNLFAGNANLTYLVNFLASGDTFDGRNYTLLNLKVPFVDLIEGGKLTNVNIKTFKYLSDKTSPIGTLALRMTAGELTDCDIIGIHIETKGPVGALVGDATGGTISGNEVSGLLIGISSSVDGLTGQRTDNVTCTNNKYSAIIF